MVKVGSKEFLSTVQFECSSFLALSFDLFVLFVNALNAMLKSNITAQ